MIENSARSAATRIPLTGFLIWGLLTFWVYTVIRLAEAWREHVDERWREFCPLLETQAPDPAALEALRARGFSAGTGAPRAAVAAFALSGLLVGGWFIHWIVIGGSDDYWMIVSAVGCSSLLFYAGVCAFTLWLVRGVHAHEATELLIVEHGVSALDAGQRPTDAFVRRSEEINNQVALFLIVAVPMVASPTVGAHLLMTGITADYAAWPAALCFAIAAVFHYWGTKLLVGLCNNHFAFEASRDRVAPATGSVKRTEGSVRGRNPAADGDCTLKAYDGTEPFIFVSYKRDDLDRVLPVMKRIGGWGYRMWYDRGIPGGAEWDALIEEKLKGCVLLLFFVSRGSVESKYCRREVKYIDQLNKPILSIRLEPAELGHGLEMLLTQYQMIDASAGDFSGEIERALKYLRLL